MHENNLELRLCHTYSSHNLYYIQHVYRTIKGAPTKITFRLTAPNMHAKRHIQIKDLTRCPLCRHSHTKRLTTCKVWYILNVSFIEAAFRSNNYHS